MPTACASSSVSWYAADEKVGGPKLVHAGCWTQSRRKFFDAVKLNPADAVATRLVKLIDEWFGVDALAREEKFDHAARHVLRLETAQPLVASIHGEAETVRKRFLAFECLGESSQLLYLGALAVGEARASWNTRGWI